MRNQQNIEQLLRRIPKKWAIAIVAVVIAYTVAQPFLNKQFGWSLPGIGNNQARVESPDRQTQDRDNPANEQSIVGPGRVNSSAVDSNAVNSNAADSSQERQPPATLDSKTTNPNFEEYLLAIAPDGTGNQEELYDYLSPLGRGKYQSPHGLIYTRSSDDRHRILHIARHLKDQPNRPGKHGVFDGDIGSVLRLIDDTYSRAVKGQRGTKKKQQGDRTVLEAEFSKPVGFVGGREGGRRNNPDARRVRIVVADKNVITAFPF